MCDNKNKNNFKINELQEKFVNLQNSRKSVLEVFTFMSEIIDNLTKLYKDLSKPNSNNKLLIICLDSFHFQKVLLNTEYKNLLSFFNTISNRLYCDYYKLNLLIISYIKETIKPQKNMLKIEKTILKKIENFNKYPKYDDLNITKEYDFNNIIEIYNDIVSLLLLLNKNILHNEETLIEYRNKSKSGIKINNFIYSLESNIADIDNKLRLFCNYTLFFVDTHNTYFQKFLKKLQLTYNQISSDIKLEEGLINTDHLSDTVKNLEISLEKNLEKTNDILEKQKQNSNINITISDNLNNFNNTNTKNNYNNNSNINNLNNNINDNNNSDSDNNLDHNNSDSDNNLDNSNNNNLDNNNNNLDNISNNSDDCNNLDNENSNNSNINNKSTQLKAVNKLNLLEANKNNSESESDSELNEFIQGLDSN